ncbi:MAG: VOC family protein, partial [Sphingomonadales bacterium]|nr:VOC family protein [Sphingomonadales bacterium]
HHICIEVADIHAARATCVARGLSIEQELYYPGGGAIYVDTGGGPGTLTEMVQLVPAQRERFAAFREAARGWDGRDPLREV